MSLSKLSFGIPHDGWVDLKIDNDIYHLSYTTHLGQDFLQAASRNFSKGIIEPVTIIADGEKEGMYYIIFECGELTICHMDEEWCKHYYFGNAYSLLYIIYSELENIKDYWLKDMKENINETLNETKRHLCPMTPEMRSRVLQKISRR